MYCYLLDLIILNISYHTGFWYFIHPFLVLDCDLQLNDIEELINELNKTNGLFKFVRSMRQKFREAAAQGIKLIYCTPKNVFKSWKVYPLECSCHILYVIKVRNKWCCLPDICSCVTSRCFYVSDLCNYMNKLTRYLYQSTKHCLW